MNNNYSFINGYINGSISGIFQNIFTYPLDTLKTRLQKNNNIRTNFFAGLTESSISMVMTSSIFKIFYIQKIISPRHHLQREFSIRRHLVLSGLSRLQTRSRLQMIPAMVKWDQRLVTHSTS